jgi:hypothetical protein
MPDTAELGTETYPYDPDDAVQTAIIEQNDKEQEVLVDAEPVPVTNDMIYTAIQSLTETTADLAAQLKAMTERHDKWVKAGKF